MNDLISRQQAIEVVQNRHMMLNKEKVLLINDLEKLPSAQPEIIRCKDCEHWETQVKGVKGDGLGCCNFHKANFVTGEGFCYWAERREE